MEVLELEVNKWMIVSYEEEMYRGSVNKRMAKAQWYTITSFITTICKLLIENQLTSIIKCLKRWHFNKQNT